MLFLYVLSLLYLTQRVSTQITSESEAINKIISDILLKTDKKNGGQKNVDPIEIIWNKAITKLQEQKPINHYTSGSSKKPQINKLKVAYEKVNPTLKLHDILPELNTFHPQPERYSRKDVDIATTTSKPTTKPSHREITIISQLSKMKSFYEAKTTPPMKKKIKQKTNCSKPVGPKTKQQCPKKPAHQDNIYSKNIPNGSHAEQFSKKILKTPKGSTYKNIEKINNDKVTEENKFSSTENTSPQNKIYKNKAYANKKSSSKLPTTFQAYVPAMSVTAKDWTSLKDAEELVNSVPNYVTKTTKNPLKIATTINNEDLLIIRTDMTFKYDKAVDNNINGIKQHTEKLLDKRVTEDEEKHFIFRTDMIFEHEDSLTNKHNEVFSEKTTAKLDRKVSANKGTYKFYTTAKAFKHDETVDIDVAKKKTIAKQFDNLVIEDKNKNMLMTTSTFKQDLVDVTYKPDNAADTNLNHNTVDMNLNHNVVDMNLNHNALDTNINQNVAKDGDLAKASLDQLLQKLSGTKHTTKNYGFSVGIDNTGEIIMSTPTFKTSDTPTDLYLLIEPKDKSLKSYFTVESATTNNIETPTEDSYSNILNALGIEISTEYNVNKISDKVIMNDLNEIPFTSTPADVKVEVIKKSDIADLYKDVIEKYGLAKEEPAKDINSEKLHDKITKHLNWERIKKFFGHDRVCNCKCKANKTLCTVCAASDAVMRELSFEFNNLAEYMNTHCTEIQTFFWMNPSGGKKLRDTVHRIDKTLHDYYKRVKGKCTGRTCKTFATYLDKKRYSDKMKIRRKYLKELLRDLEVK